MHFVSHFTPAGGWLSPISMRMTELRDKGYRIFKLPAWERTRPEIVYAER